MGRTRRSITTLLILMLPAGAGVLTVHASPTCERYVRTYVTVPVRNKVSKATAVAWAKWRVAHPNWKPNPHVQRPRYKMSRQEQIQKVAFACEVPTDPQFMDTVFAPSELYPPLPAIAPPDAATPPIETAEVTPPELIPPVPPDTPPFGQPISPPVFMPPFLPPILGPPPFPAGPQHSPPPTQGSTPPTPPVVPPIAPVPEPSSLVLLGTALAAAGANRLRAGRSQR